MKSIREILRGQDTATVDRHTSVAEAARLMAARHIGALPVLDEGQVVGIFTERDVLNRIVAAGVNPAATAIGDVMSTTLVAAEVDETYDACLDRMRRAHIRHLIVFDRGRMAGVVSMRDLMAVDLDEKDEALTLLNAYVYDVPPLLGKRP